MSGRAISDPTVQSPAGPPDDAVGSWAVSLSEIDAMCRKAARGAGMSWGLAEEAGHAARELAALGLDGPGALLAALDAVDGNIAAHAPCAEGPVWRARSGSLCPVATGAALSDRARDLAAGEAVRLGPVVSPLLLLPFLVMAARATGASFRLARAGDAILATPAGPLGAAGWLRALLLDGLVVAPAAGQAGAAPAWPAPALAGFDVPVDLWRRLDRYAHRTYAPTTEASRRGGAGAGLRDND